jgi:ubiquinone/menaquinone biosynthesis C-methylase UbiE
MSQNIDPETVRGFGREWSAYDQTELKGAEYLELAKGYFEIFPFDRLPPRAEGFDLGCGSGRWAAWIAPQVGFLHCIDPSEDALEVARRNLASIANVSFHLASSDSIPLAEASQDFAYSLGVLHHIPDTPRALRDCVKKLKMGAPFLLYVYYRMENRPAWYRTIWGLSDVGRRGISRLPFPVRKAMTTAVATFLYWPLARIAWAAERFGIDVRNWPLSLYREMSFYSMRTDALDRFGTRLEQRFSRDEIERMMENTGLEEIRFRDAMPYWVACGIRKR